MPAEPFPGYAALRERVEAGLRRALDPPGGDATGPFVGLGAGCPDRLRAAMRHSLLAGGKRLRPVLTLAAFDACRAAGECFHTRLDPRTGGPLVPDIKAGENALLAAVAVEAVHTYSLVHDDLPCMDNDDLRRGRPTCHVAFGQATAVLAGDGLLTLAFELLSRLRPPVEVGAAIGELAAAAGAAGMVGGQAADLAAEGDPHSVGSGAQLEAIHRRKTGALLSAAAALGGWTAGARPAVIDALRAYGAAVGSAFQIADDLLDLSADSLALGKTAGKDVAAGKLTYPALYGEAGSRRRADELIAAAREELAPLGDHAAPLHTLARYAVERDR